MSNTLRLLMPQWQGGNNPPYFFGARLLAWLAPEAGAVTQIEVPVPPHDGTALIKENGVAGQSVLLRQLQAAQEIIEEHRPDKIIVFGGDCLVSQAPFAYLNERYDGKLGVLWLDAHPDISTPQMHNHEHAMVLGNLLGEGDPVFAAQVRRTIHPSRVMYGGLQQNSSEEEAVVRRLNLRRAGPAELAESTHLVLDWIAQEGIAHLAIHFDLDVLDPKWFHAILPCEPVEHPYNAVTGEMTLHQVARVIREVSEKTDVVGLSIAEHLPWDAWNLHHFLADIPIFQQ